MKNKIKYIIKKILKLFLIIIITILIYEFYISLQTPSINAEIKAQNQGDINNNSITDILENSFNSVVGISKLKNNGNSIFLMNASEELGLGTGIIVSKSGYILTNEHVSGQNYCYVTTNEGKTSKAEVIWSDKDLDLAIIKVDESFNTCANLGDSENIKIGEDVYAIGNPIGYEFQRTVTSGIISSLNRTIKLEEDSEYIYMSNLIQTDATINPGNSGGPLIDKKGNIIGINTIKITSADGMGFAIPINVVKPIIEKIEVAGEFKEAYLGVFAHDLSVIPYIYSSINLGEGVYIESIDELGPAYETEIQIGDIITKIDESKINKMLELQEYLYSKNPEDEVTLTIVRNNKEKKINIVLGNKQRKSF